MRKSGDRSWASSTAFRSEGNEGASCRFPNSCAAVCLRPRASRPPSLPFSSALSLPRSAHAASIRGVVTDATGAKVTGASVALVSNGTGRRLGRLRVRRQLSDSRPEPRGRFFLVVSAKSFRQLQTPDFYAGQFDSIERNLVLEPEWVRESIVVTATGTPTPQPQTSAATTVLGPLDLALRDGSCQRAAADAGNRRCAGRPAGRADLALCPRRRLRRQQDSARRRRRRRSWQSVRFRPALHHGDRERGGLSRTRLESLRRRR